MCVFKKNELWKNLDHEDAGLQTHKYLPQDFCCVVIVPVGTFCSSLQYTETIL